MDVLQFSSFYLVGVKGVAMTALAQCLLDAGKQVRGSDVAEKFVTQGVLEARHVQIDLDFAAEIPADVECVIYTAAHHAQDNPQVLAARARGLVVLTHAEALGLLFNQKQGIAVCGVGGKSTVSAMITWILTQLAAAGVIAQSSFAVGVGNILGLDKTGQWVGDSPYFVAEADEYVTDPSAPARGEEITPRFSYLQPFVTVCTNLRFDHPDVYRDFAHTQSVYKKFFLQIKPNGFLIVNADDEPLLKLAQAVIAERPDVTLLTFGKKAAAETASAGVTAPANAHAQLADFSSQPGQSVGHVRLEDQSLELRLRLPGEFNMQNALAAFMAVQMVKLPQEKVIEALATFRSTSRRSEFIGEKNSILYYDDYAHHPNEVAQMIGALKAWYPDRRLVIAFQSHTFSRTKALRSEFVRAFAQADEVVMIDIFASARESSDPTISSDVLCQDITHQFPKIYAQNLKTISALAEYCRTQLHPGDVLATLGAGDIYNVHTLIHDGR